MRDRLIELLNKKYDHFCDQCGVNKDSYYTESLADHLLENGVIVPRCKIGQAIYRIDDKSVFDWWDVEHIEIYAEEIVYIDDSGNQFTDEDIGKTVFLTREEAEQALKGGAEE